jgi:hypothetical protein
MDWLNYPEHLSCRPVLIHLSGVTLPLTDSGFFSHLVDAGEWLMLNAPRSSWSPDRYGAQLAARHAAGGCWMTATPEIPP